MSRTFAPRQLPRAVFARQMAKVDRGMTKRQVTQLLGPPDTIRDEKEREVTSWSYGVGPISGFATLGTVCFDPEGTVATWYGGKGTPPKESQIPEKKLRYLIDLIASLGWDFRIADFSTFDPTSFIEVANQFIPEGKTATLLAVDEYNRVSHWPFGPEIENVDLLLLILFTPPSGRSFRPNMQITEQFPSPINRNAMTRFPLVLLEDVPIFSVGATHRRDNGVYMPLVTYKRGSGIDIPPHPDRVEFLKNIKRSCVMRTTLLKPPPNPLAVFDKLAISDQWYWSVNCKKERPTQGHFGIGAFGGGSEGIPWHQIMQWEGRHIAWHQLLRMVRPVYPSANRYFHPLVPGMATDTPKRMTEAEWQKCCREVAALNLEWTPQTNRYQARNR